MWLCINDLGGSLNSVHVDQFALHGAVQSTDFLTVVIISQCLLIMQILMQIFILKNV